MNPLEQLALAGLALVRAARTLGLRPALAAGAGLAVLHAVVLAALAWAAHPLLSGSLGAALARLSEDALRYPRHLERLPEWGMAVAAMLGALVAPAVAARVMRLTLADAARAPLPRAAFRDMAAEAPRLVVAALPGLLAAAAIAQVPEWVADLRMSSLIRALLASACAVGAFVMAAWWTPAVAMVALEDASLAAAWRATVRSWGTLGLALPVALAPIALATTVPAAVLLDGTGAWLARGWPEGIVLTAVVHAVAVAVAVVAGAGAVGLLVAARPREGDTV
jgi:hypothetical protein